MNSVGTIEHEYIIVSPKRIYTNPLMEWEQALQDLSQMLPFHRIGKRKPDPNQYGGKLLLNKRD